MKILVNGKEIASVLTNHGMTLEEAMYAAGWDITDQADCERGYHDGIEGFYLHDDGFYSFDIEAAEMAY